ncbi:SIL1 [Candida jiufengensis]|uniref:SIL1 n=1 Tax=Candida jiufengensis TaxID=497108 RepID=UPI002224888E|nr:SIL1 [Candida jiufengensis]KAI5957169.1 SIL1 [Candida jiufengensis]
MKKAIIISILLQLLNLVKSTHIEEELICPNPQNPQDCYPKLFEATSNWQEIKQGQEIPPGLHVRLNMDTLKKEAKLMSPEDETEPQNELIVGETEEQEQEPQQESQPDQKILDLTNELLKHKSGHKSRVKPEDMSEFDSAIYEVEEYNHSNTEDQKLVTALDTLEELCHDIELGVKITSNHQLIAKLLSIASTTSNSEISEKSYNIIASSLRNNPEAVLSILHSEPNILDELFSAIASTTNDTIQKRILGIIQALIQNDNFKSKFSNLNDKNSGISKLINLFLQLGKSSQSRCINIINDLNLITKSNDRRSLEDTDPSSNLSTFLQSLFTENKLSDQNFQTQFKNLVDLHSDNKHLKPSRNFLNWLAEEVETRKESNNKLKRDLDHIDDDLKKDIEFDEFMLRVRHEVFGNPMGMRKAIADEL